MRRSRREDFRKESTGGRRGPLAMHRCVDEHVFTSWSTIREELPGEIFTVTLARTCVLCGFVEDARREPEEQAA